MQDKTLSAGIIFTLLGVLLILLVWFFFMRPTEIASAPISAAPIKLASGNTRFEIRPSFSETRFIINEKLRGSRMVVVGATNQVSGELGINLEDLSAAQVGEIRINARTIATDNDFRDTAIRNRILFTDQYEFITFVPTELSGLPDRAAVGERIKFNVVGDLTIGEITHSESFAVDVIVEEEIRLRGKASTLVDRSTYGLNIPAAPGVTDVDQQVLLELDFVAVVVVVGTE
jgi:polyisoprenoid-binding protein YceI